MTSSQPIPFKTETRQLLNILIHSLYTDREIFLRELISNASDALTRLNFEMLTNRDILDPEAELCITIKADAENKVLTVSDSGVGMTAAEMEENLGTIAHSGARAFIEAAKDKQAPLSNIIGQFGVGFYSAFMAADSIEVVSRSFRTDAQAACWRSAGEDSYTIEPAEKSTRGTDIILHLKEDSTELLQDWKLRQVVQTHSNYIPFPIYIGTEGEQANQQTILWRKQPKEVEAAEYNDFYKQFTLEMDEPLAYTHLNIDAPVQLYAVLYLPSSAERGVFSLRKDEGVKLFARKVLIQEYSTDLLPTYLRFVQGVVDSEDLPLNVSREAIQSTAVIKQLRKILTGKVIDLLKSMAKDQPEKYEKFWKEFGRFIKEGIATEADALEPLSPLLRFHSLQNPHQYISLDDYIQQRKEGQTKIYTILGEDERSLVHSPHLEIFRRQGMDVLLLTDPIDSFMLLRLQRYQEYTLANAATENLEPAEADKPTEETPSESTQQLIERFKQILGDRVSDVRITHRLIESPARLVDPQGGPSQELQRVYKLLNKEFEVPRRVLELNPEHPILKHLADLPVDSPLSSAVVEQVFENTLLIEGLHPDPASMISRIQTLMEAAINR